MTTNQPDAVSRPTGLVSGAFVRNMVAKILTLPTSPGRWLSDLMDEADDIWDLIDDDDVGISVTGPVNGLG